jgi:hypothetical protein
VKGDVVTFSLVGANRNLAVDMEIDFTGVGITLTGNNGTTINGLAVLVLNNIDTVRGALSTQDDTIVVTGVADMFQLDLRQGDNSIEFDNFNSSRLTSVSGAAGALDFQAKSSSFNGLTVLGGRLGDDVIDLSAVNVLGRTNIQLYNGLDSLEIDDSTFTGRAVFGSTGANTSIDIETSATNGIATNFLDQVQVTVGASAAIDISPLVGSDNTNFQKLVKFTGRAPNSTVTQENAFFNGGVKTKNVDLI